MNTVYRLSRIVLLAALILGGCKSTVLPLGGVGRVPADPAQAEQLIVKVRRSNSLGGGIIFHRRGNRLFIATARHVVGSGIDVKVEFSFFRGTPVEATVINTNSSLDLAVLRVDLKEVSDFPVASISFNQIGFVDTFEERYQGAVASNQAYRVYPMGFPEGLDWHYPLSPPEVRSVVGERITIEYDNCEEGNSGGGLFSDHWQLVGMVTNKSGPTCQAISFDRIYKELVDEWRLRVSLRPVGAEITPAAPEPTPTAPEPTLTAPDPAVADSLGTLLIGAYPGGQLFIDDEPTIERLTTVVALVLPATRHKVRVVNPKYAVWEREVMIPAGGQTDSILVNFKRLQGENP